MLVVGNCCSAAVAVDANYYDEYYVFVVVVVVVDDDDDYDDDVAVVGYRPQTQLRSRCLAGNAAPSHYDSRIITLISKLEKILQSRTTFLHLREEE